MQTFDYVFPLVVFTVHWCGLLPLCYRWSLRGFPAKICFDPLNFLAGLIECLHSFSV